jgi:hypothetical protein
MRYAPRHVAIFERSGEPSGSAIRDLDDRVRAVLLLRSGIVSFRRAHTGHAAAPARSSVGYVLLGGCVGSPRHFNCGNAPDPCQITQQRLLDLDESVQHISVAHVPIWNHRGGLRTSQARQTPATDRGMSSRCCGRARVANYIFFCSSVALRVTLSLQNVIRYVGGVQL